VGVLQVQPVIIARSIVKREIEVPLNVKGIGEGNFLKLPQG
jgi:hypothetical protein